MGLLDIIRKTTSDMNKQVKDSLPAENILLQTNTTEPPKGLDGYKLPEGWIRLPMRNQRTHEEKVKALKAKKIRKAQKAARKRNRR